MFLLALVYLSPACRRERDSAGADPPPERVKQEPAEFLVFPQELRVEEEAVNDFVERAMTACAGGDYGRFRLLWTAREDPLPRDEYENAWQAVQRIQILALEKVMLSPDAKRGREHSEIAYAVLADVTLNPTHPAGRRDPHREAVLMLIPEEVGWRLARAPKAMRLWIRERGRSREAGSVVPADEPSNRKLPD